MIGFKLFALISIFFAFTSALYAESGPVEDTMQMLRDSKRREAEQKNSPDAQQSDAQIKSLVGSPENAEKAYDISAQIFGSMAEKTNGKPEDMEKLLEKAQQNPEEFFKQLSPEQQQQIRDLAGKVDKKNSLP